MRPILLHSHERSLTKVVYNKDGDLILSTAKDSKPNVWFAHNGERLGSLNGHNGAVWDICPTSDSTMALTASADASMMLWNLHSGKQLFAWLFKAPCRCVDLYQDIIACVTDQAMGQPSTIHFLDIKACIFN